MSVLHAKARNALPAKDFAGPDRSYPIENESHARNALARSSGKPVHAKVASAVARKFPAIKQSNPEHVKRLAAALHKH